MTILSLIDNGILKSTLSDASIMKLRQQLFSIRYAGGSKELSKFSAIGEATGKSGQTVRSLIMQSWGQLGQVAEEVVGLIAKEVRAKMKELSQSSISYHDLAGVGVFGKMTKDDVSCLVHDVVSYVEEAGSVLFIVRKNGESMVSVIDQVDDFKASEQSADANDNAGNNIPASALQKVSALFLESSSLGSDIYEAVKILCPQYVKVLNDRCGMVGGAAKTLSEVGQIHGVTRERIRQTTGTAIKRLMFAERLHGNGPLTRMLETIGKYAFDDQKVIDLKSVIEENDYLSSFVGNEHGLFLLLSMCNVDNVIQSAGFFLHAKEISKDHALHEISKVKHQIKKSNAKEKMHQMMAVFPISLKKKARALADASGISANAYYERLLKTFLDALPESKASIDWKDVEWKEVGSSWKMINMRLPKELIDRITEVAGGIEVNGEVLSRTALVYNVIQRYAA